MILYVFDSWISCQLTFTGKPITFDPLVQRFEVAFRNTAGKSSQVKLDGHPAGNFGLFEEDLK